MRNYRLYLEDIVDSIDKINAYTKGMSLREFSKEQKTIDAVVRNFEIIGEATRQLPASIKANYPEIEWKSMNDFRNVIIHEYFGIDFEIMWDIIETKLLPLKKKLAAILKSLPKKSA